MNDTELASLLEVSKKTVWNWRKSGMPTDSAGALRWRNRYCERSTAGRWQKRKNEPPPPPPSPPSIELAPPPPPDFCPRCGAKRAIRVRSERDGQGEAITENSCIICGHVEYVRSVRESEETLVEYHSQRGKDMANEPTNDLDLGAEEIALVKDALTEKAEFHRAEADRLMREAEVQSQRAEQYEAIVRKFE